MYIFFWTSFGHHLLCCIVRSRSIFSPLILLIGLLFIELVLLLLLVLFSPRLAWILHYTPFDPVFILVYLNRTTPRVLFESKRSKQERARRHRSSEDDRNKKYDTRRKEASREITRRRYVRFFIRWNFTCVLFVCVCVFPVRPCEYDKTGCGGVLPRVIRLVPVPKVWRGNLKVPWRRKHSSHMDRCG